MSNFLAVATISAALQRMLAPVVHAAVDGAVVWIDRPDVAHSKSGTNIYLYGVSIDSALPDLATRPDDTPASSRITLDLHYLMTFQGNEDRLEPQRLLGAVLAALHDRPVITASLLTDVLTAATGPEPGHRYLAASDLRDTHELVRVDTDPLSLEEMSRLWSLFPGTPYRLSATYVVRAVTLGTADER